MRWRGLLRRGTRERRAVPSRECSLSREGALRDGVTRHAPGPARCEEANLRTDVIRVDQRARIVAWRLGAATLLGRDRLRARRKAGNSESDLATVTGRQLRGLRVERFAGDRGH